MDSRYADPHGKPRVPSQGCCTREPSAGPGSRIERALSLLEQGELQAAGDLINEILLETPENVELILIYGQVLMLLDDTAGAQREFMKATVLDPSNATAFTKLAAALFQSGRFRNSEVYARRALGLDPGQGEALDILNRIANGAGNGQADSSLDKISREPAGLKIEDALPLLKEAESCLLTDDLVGCTSKLKQIVQLHAGLIKQAPEGDDAVKSVFSSVEFKRTLAEIMISPHGAAIRQVIPELYPWCDIIASTPMGFSILADGSVTTCCFDSEGKNGFGSIHKSNILDLWERYNRIRTGDLYRLDLCRKCAALDVQYAPSLINAAEERPKKIAELSEYPSSIAMEPISMCNYACENCPTTYTKRHSKLDLELTFNNLKPFLPHIDKIVFGLYGEPLLHPDLGGFITKCRQTSSSLIMHALTNGTFLTRELARTMVEQKLNNICVAVHGGPGTENMLRYSKRGADYEKVMGNVANLISIRKELNAQLPNIQIRVVLFNWNDSDEDMDRFRRDVRALGLEKQDTYFWVLDVAGSDHPRASKRFLPGSPELQRLIDAKEFSYW